MPRGMLFPPFTQTQVKPDAPKKCTQPTKISSTFGPCQSLLLALRAARPPRTNARMSLSPLDDFAYHDEGHVRVSGADAALERDAGM